VAVECKPGRPSRLARARRRTPTAALPALAERQRAADLLRHQRHDSRPLGAEAREERPSAAARSSLGRDRGVALLLILVAATLIMVAAVVAVTLVDRWWVLAPVMLVDVAAAFAVLASITSLLGDDDGGPPA
jgi:hypothetical protein